LGVFHDYENQEARAEDIPPGGFFSWRQGVERLRISRIMTIPDDIDAESRPHFSGLVPFADINTGDDRLLEKFCRIVKGLVGAVKRLTMASASAQAWKDAFFRVVDQFIEISADMRGEETVYQSLIRAFDEFLRYDELAQVQPGTATDGRCTVGICAVPSGWDQRRPGRLPYRRGDISALMPMRPIPFKLVYVLGLEEGRFPWTRDRKPAGFKEQKTPYRRYHHCGTQSLSFSGNLDFRGHRKLYLSYVSRDLQKDRDLAPCSVVHQLRRYVEQQVLGGQSFKIGRIPIKAGQPGLPDAVGHGQLVGRDGQQQQCPASQLLSPQRAVGCVYPSGDLSRVGAGRPVLSGFFIARPFAGNEPTETVDLTIGLLAALSAGPGGADRAISSGYRRTTRPHGRTG
jgi:exonuclease V gamma subunit